MSWTELGLEQALSEGSTLWVVGELETSSWASKINWYLNFQLRRAKFHQTKKMPRELVSVLQTWEVDALELSLDESAPLLIETSKLVPAQMTLQLFNRSFDAWLEEAQRAWANLQKPSVRVFLPAGKSTEQLAAKWKLPAGVVGTCVLD